LDGVKKNKNKNKGSPFDMYGLPHFVRPNDKTKKNTSLARRLTITLLFLSAPYILTKQKGHYQSEY
jgi:hypothetical protein